ncbi:EamA family transporter [Salinifilum ghardaiensis]
MRAAQAPRGQSEHRPLAGFGRAFGAIPPPMLVLCGVISLQVGAAFAKHLFAVVGAGGMVWLRLLFAALVLLAVWRPALRGRSLRTWLVIAGYGAVLAGMNIAIYHSIERIPLGVAVTIEFLGPLAVAVLGSRRKLDLVWAAFAAVGVLLLARGDGGLDVVGVLLALLAAVCWGGYILVGGKLGEHTRGGAGLALGMAFGALVATPLGTSQAGAEIARPEVLLAGAAVALLSSVIPYSLELEALRRMPASVFGVLMSLEPAVAALAGLAVLGEWLGPWQWVAVACVVIASVGSTRTRRM